MIDYQDHTTESHIMQMLVESQYFGLQSVFYSSLQLSLRDNPLVTRFVNSCAREIMYNPPSLLELAARVIKLKKVTYTKLDLPQSLITYLTNGQRCVNPRCKGEFSQ